MSSAPCSREVKNRPFSHDEFMVYMMGSFEFGDTIEDLSIEHNRSYEFVAAKIEKYLSTDYGRRVAEKYFNRGVVRCIDTEGIDSLGRYLT